jgi:DNA-binding transcriptional LysR family regulator
MEASMKMNSLDLNKLKIFSSVVRNGGYKGASEELNLTRSAISQAITQLESSIGLKLFLRFGNQMHLTDEAQKFHSDLERYNRSLIASLEKLTSLKQQTALRGTLVIGAFLEFAKSQLIPVLKSFMENHPEVQLKLVFDSPSRLQKLLETHKIDISLSIFPHAGVKSISSVPLMTEELVLVAKKDSAFDISSAKQILLAPVIDYFPQHLLIKSWWKVHFGEKSTPHFHIRTYAASADMVVEMVLSGLGIGVVPRYLIEKELSCERLRILRPTSGCLIDHLWLNQHQSTSARPLQKAFVSAALKHFESHAHPLGKSFEMGEVSVPQQIPTEGAAELPSMI